MLQNSGSDWSTISKSDQVSWPIPCVLAESTTVIVELFLHARRVLERLYRPLHCAVRIQARSVPSEQRRRAAEYSASHRVPQSRHGPDWGSKHYRLQRYRSGIGRNPVEQLGQDIAVGDILVRPRNGTRMTDSRVERDMHFAPRPTLRMAMVANLRFAFAVGLHARAVGHQIRTVFRKLIIFISNSNLSHIAHRIAPLLYAGVHLSEIGAMHERRDVSQTWRPTRSACLLFV